MARDRTANTGWSAQLRQRWQVAMTDFKRYLIFDTARAPSVRVTNRASIRPPFARLDLAYMAFKIHSVLQWVESSDLDDHYKLPLQDFKISLNSLSTIYCAFRTCSKFLKSIKTSKCQGYFKCQMSGNKKKCQHLYQHWFLCNKLVN